MIKVLLAVGIVVWCMIAAEEGINQWIAFGCAAVCAAGFWLSFYVDSRKEPASPKMARATRERANDLTKEERWNLDQDFHARYKKWLKAKDQKE